MNTLAEKTKENKKQPVSASSSQIQSSGEPTFQFEDNRPETIAQRKLQEMVNNSPHAKQAAQMQAMAGNHSSKQQKPIQKKANNTGLPDNLKSGIENLSGYSMDDVNVHYNSDKPAQLNAHAFAQGTDIHLASGQEKHLPHEAWHVVQQKQGRVKPTRQMKSKVNINDDADLEKEADVMGAKALTQRKISKTDDTASKEKKANISPANSLNSNSTTQRVDIKKSWKQNRKRFINPARRTPGKKQAKWLREYNFKLDAVKSFMENRVAPWATQARISELINENMVEMKKDKTIPSSLTYLEPSKYRKADEQYTPQIAPGDSKFLAPSRSEGREQGKSTVIHRGDLEIEMIGNKPCVRVYSALWAEAKPNEQGEITHKDIHQDTESGNILIHTGRDQGEKHESADEEDDKNPIMWVSGGQPLRQLKWFYKYQVEKNNPGAKPVVRSFLVPLDVWNIISSHAVNEESAKKQGSQDRPFNVDTAYGANQFGVRGPMLELLRAKAMPNSLVSYTGQKGHSSAHAGGTVQNIRELHKKLGAPLTKPPLPVWVDKDQGKFVRTAKQESNANTLMFYYGIWTGNKEFFPKDKVKIPNDRLHEMFKEFLKEHGLELPENYQLPNP
ncbi:MAG: DUF4157 domain-containing protein [Reichenbachiella sp.]|uniref:eCIS core domain-containing protein n=1 Tax=Reichenbachiella sp. TaxID=2184521 RepID=UPI0032967E9F